MIRIVRNRHAHFVQVRRPAQRRAQFGAFLAFGEHRVKQRQRGMAHAARLIHIHVVALHELAHRFVALVVFVVAAQQVIQHA
ncbi:hypothetical protein D3C73_1354120 [compost metagenome]